MKKVRLLIHHHAVAFQDSKGIWLQSFIAEWVIHLSKYFEEIGLLLPCSIEKKLSQDILIQSNKIKLHSLGEPGKGSLANPLRYYGIIKKRNKIKKLIDSIKNSYDLFLVRGITPKQSLVSNRIQVRYSKKYFLLVGSQKFDFKTLGIVSVADIVSMFFKFYRRYQFRKLVRNMKLLVNGKNLISKNDYDGIPYFIPTNTISEMYYSSKFKKIKENI